MQILSKKFALLLLCLLIPFAGLWAQKTIVIGSSAKADHPFAAFDSLLTEVSSGNITGQITFAFESGSYALSKAIVVNSAKFTAKDHLTITSVAKDRDSVVFSYNGSIAALQLNNTKNVTFSHITISAIATDATHITITRLLTLPPMAEPMKRPISIKIQYRPAIKPAAAKPTRGVRYEMSVAGIPTSTPT